MRKPVVAANWKMHGTSSKIKNWLADFAAIKTNKIVKNIDIILFPPFPYITQVRQVTEWGMHLGSQNFYQATEGAFTGEVAGSMLKDIGCQYVLVGHSERRTFFHEDLLSVANKFKAAIEMNLIPILCLGETLLEREQGLTEKVIESQLMSVVQLVGIESFQHAIIAYEPVWAIGTSLSATQEEAQSVHWFIRNLITQNNVDIAETIRILYGGSIKTDNASSLFSMPDIDGGLVGGASLNANHFALICEAASNTQEALT